MGIDHGSCQSVRGIRVTHDFIATHAADKQHHENYKDRNMKIKAGLEPHKIHLPRTRDLNIT